MGVRQSAREQNLCAVPFAQRPVCRVSFVGYDREAVDLANALASNKNVVSGHDSCTRFC